MKLLYLQPLRGGFAEQIRGDKNYPFTKIINERSARCRRDARVLGEITPITPLIRELILPSERIQPTAY